MFTWKWHKDIFKGEGIYHLTFVVRDRVPILGELQMIDGVARIVPSKLGSAISHDLNALQNRRPYCRLLAKQLMPDHIHVLIWLTEDCGVSVKEIARGMRQGWKYMATAELQVAKVPNATTEPNVIIEPNAAVNINRQMTSAEKYKQPPLNDFKQLHSDSKHPPLFSAPFIRTLSRKGQLDTMIAYIHDNPRRAMLRRLNPDLFRLRRELHVEGLTFTAMGNLFLLDYPQRQAIECSRSASAEQIVAQQTSTLQAAEKGTVSYSGAISAGEKQIVRAIREAGLPVVVVLNDGFPPTGSEHERYYKPGGVYFEACSAGRLLLLEPTAATLESELVVTLTEQALRNKAEVKHQDYVSLPHTSKRWRMVANNCIAEILVKREK